MPWKVTAPVESKQRFIQEWLKKELTFSELCESHEISQKTGYKWVERYKQEGQKGLAERSHAPHAMPWAVPDSMQKLLVSARIEHPTWGPRKLLVWMQNRYPGIKSWPAPSTVGDLFKRRGLVQTKRRRKSPLRSSSLPFDDNAGPNAVHCIDFKGWFRTRDGARCNPLTITDAHSRFLLCCQHLDRGTNELVRAQLERVFAEFGLPEVIHSDNGPPFGSIGLGGLSKLSVWLLCHGVNVSFIEPGHPEQNGRHERMHRTLQHEVALRPAANLLQQQRALDRFLHEYNWERPHEALKNKTPGSVYRPSTRKWPAKKREPEYPEEARTRLVRSSGEISWNGTPVFVGEAFINHSIALVPVNDGEHKVQFYNHVLGILDERKQKIRVR